MQAAYDPGFSYLEGGSTDHPGGGASTVDGSVSAAATTPGSSGAGLRHRAGTPGVSGGPSGPLGLGGSYDADGGGGGYGETNSHGSRSDGAAQAPRKRSGSSTPGKPRQITIAVFVLFILDVVLVGASHGFFSLLLFILISCVAMLVTVKLRDAKLLPKWSAYVVIAFCLAPVFTELYLIGARLLAGAGGTDMSSAPPHESAASSSASAAATTWSAGSGSVTREAATSSGGVVNRLVPVFSTVAEGQLLNIHCPEGGVVESVDFASYGTPSACAGWRQTKGCDPDGERENASDLGCASTVPSQSSGYCECADGSRAAKNKCGHPQFTCHGACETVVSCSGWRSVSGCDPDKGQRAGQLQSCDQVVAPHEAGFCECSQGIVVRKVGCDHDPFTCEEECARGRPQWPPMQILDSCHSPTSEQVVREHCLGKTGCAVKAGWPFGDDPCPDSGVAKRLHVRVTCRQRVKRPARVLSVGEICRRSTDALKACLETNLIRDMRDCQAQIDAVLQCQERARKFQADAGRSD